MAEARHTRTTDEQGRVVFLSYKVWHIDHGFRSFKTKEEAKEYIKQHGAARFDEVRTTVLEM